jgi:hypothetical protein
MGLSILSKTPFNYALSRGFWDFKACSKRNVLYDRTHFQQIVEALCDSETTIEVVDRHSYLIYNDDDSLLIQTSHPLVLLFLAACCSMPHIN